MKYRRFLTLNDYLGVINKNHLSQVSDGFNEDKFIKAEENSETTMTEYLVENYQIEEALEVGKAIVEFNRLISYPQGVYFEYEGEIVRSMLPIQGVVIPTSDQYWTEDLGILDDEKENYKPYTQLSEYFSGDMVFYGGKYYTCVITNGYAFENIRIPGVINGWTKLDPLSLTAEQKNSLYVFDFEKNDYATGDMIIYNEDYYIAAGDVNFNLPEYGNNIKMEDPRNKSIRNHLVRLAVYELYKSISPNNVSMTVLKDYEDSQKWLDKCNKMNINPGIDRRTRVDPATGLDNGVSVDWAVGTFGQEQGVNAWLT